MCDYRQMYLYLFNAVTDAIEQLQNTADSDSCRKTVENLIAAQQKCEEIFIEE